MQRSHVRFGDLSTPVRYDDGEVSFTIPPRGTSTLQLPLRRQRTTAAASAVGSSSSQSEELRTPASFTAIRDAASAVEESPLSAACEVPYGDVAVSTSPSKMPDPVALHRDAREDRQPIASR